MIENTGENLEIKDFEQEYLKNKAILDRYENSPAVQKQNIEEEEEEQLGEFLDAETQAQEDNAPGVIDYVSGFVQHLGVGAAKGVEETLQTVGAIEDDAWNLPEPENIAESLGQGVGQFLPMFGVGSVAIKGGLKLVNLFQKAGALSTAGKTLTAMGAGAFSDIVAFDPKDPNMGNLALSIGAVSQSPRASAFIREYLAQDDNDSETEARLKSALTGMIAGAITEGLIRTAGWSYKKIKKTPKDKPITEPTETPTEIPTETPRDTPKQPKIEYEPQDEFGPSPKELKEAEEIGQEAGPILADALEQVKVSGGARELGEKMPTPEAGAVGDLNFNFVSDVWEKLKAEDSQFTEDLFTQLEGFAAGKGLPLQEMTVRKTFTKPDGTKVTKEIPVIESINFLKLETEAEMQNALQFFAKNFNIKKLAKPETANQDLETVLTDLLDPFYNSDLEAMDQVIDIIGQKAANVDEAIRYVGSAKLLHHISMARLEKQSAKFAKSQNPNDRLILEELVTKDEMLHRASGLLSFKFGQGLRAHQVKKAPLQDKELLASELRKDVINSTKKTESKGHKRHQKVVEQDQHKINEIKETGELTEKVQLEGVDDGTGRVRYTSPKRKVTAKASETRSGKPRGDRIAKAHKTIQTVEARQASKAARLKAQAASEKRPERGQPFPKDRPIPDTPEIKYWRGQIKKIKQERDTIENKFKREAKEQLKYRKEFEDLSAKIKALDEGQIPTSKKTKQPLKPVEIKKLKAEYKRKLKKAQKNMGKAELDKRKIDQLTAKHTELLMKQINKINEIDPDALLPNAKGDKNPLIKKLEKAIKKEEQLLKDRVTRAELEEVLLDKTKALTLEEVNNMDLRQLRTRIAALKKGMVTKGADGLLEIYINGLLSSFKTIGAVNPIGNTSAFVSTVIERAFAGATGNQIAMRESVELAWNFISGMPEAFQTFLSAMKTGTSDWNVKFDLTNPNERMISKEAFNVGGNLGKVIDLMGTVVNLPGKLLLSSDEAFKGLVIRGEQRALAWRKARNKFSSEDLKSPEVKAKIQKEFDDIVSDFSKHEDITEAARETAAKNSFTNDLSDKLVEDPRTGKTKPVPGLSKSFQQTLDRHRFMKVFIPFFRTPVNILNFTWERTPILQFANKNLRNELTSSNKAIQQLAMARVGTSFAITTAMFGLAMSGNFTGAPPRDRRLRKNMEIAMGGRHWHSVYLWGGWRKYDRFDPYGILMASSAAMATMGKSMIDIKGQINETGDPTGELEEKYNEVINATVIGTLEMIKDRHYIQGISEFISLVSGDNRGLTPSFKRLSTFLNPTIGFYSSLRRAATRGIDTEKPRKLQRGVGTTGDQNIFKKLAEELELAHHEALRDVVPGHGNKEPEKDLVGNVVSFPGTEGEFDVINNLLNPLPKLSPSKSPLIQKLAELESTVEQPSSIKKVGNTILSEEEKTFIIDKWTSLNKQIIEPLINTPMFKNSGAGLQKLMIETLIRKHKDAAKNIALVQFPRLKNGYTDFKVNEAQRKITQNPTQGFQAPNMR